MKVELFTNLKHQATKILVDLHLPKEQVLITEHGQASAYLVDVEDYEFMQRRLELPKTSPEESMLCLREEPAVKKRPGRK